LILTHLYFTSCDLIPYHHFSSPSEDNSNALTASQACIVIQGFADAIIYGVNESSISVWREKFRRRSSSAPTEEPQRLHINVAHEIRLERMKKGPGSDGDSV